MNDPRQYHHDGGRAECQRLAARALAALEALANLSGSEPLIDLEMFARETIVALYPEASAGPTDPIDPPKK